MQSRAIRGAWRRSPLVPGTKARLAATVSAPPAWAEAPEARRVPLTGGAPAAEATVSLRRGGCLCGAVRYEIRGEPLMVGLCHCEDCRKATGGLALHYADWPAAAVTVTGELRSFAGRSFCPACGSRVLHDGGETVEVLLGTLDDPPTDLAPQREIWTVRREPWLSPVPGAEQWERDPA
jgi:hypothetical protein